MRWLVALSVCLAAACSLFVDTGNLDSAPPLGDAAPGTDAGAIVPGDAGAGVDADEDGTTTIVAPDAGEPCDSLVADDFDVGLLGVHWTSIVTTSGTAALTSDASVSPPNALAITLLPPDSGPSPSVYLKKTFARSKHVCCRFALDADVPQNPNTHRLLSLRGQGENYGLIIAEATGQMLVTEGYYPGSSGGTAINRIAAQRMAPNGWTHVRVSASLPASTGIGSFSVALEGVIVMQGTLGAADDDLGIDEVILGAEYTQGPAPRVLRYDDVACGTF